MFQNSRRVLRHSKAKAGFLRKENLLLLFDMSRTISRVLSLGNHLSRPGVAARLKRPTRKQTGRLMLPVGLASDGVYMCPSRYREGGSLLHCPSTLTGEIPGGIFLLHWPWSRLHRMLSGILPCEARTFLTCPKAAAITCSTPITRFRRSRPERREPFYALLIVSHFPLKKQALYVKAASPDEFFQQGIVRNRRAVNAQEVIKKLQQPFRLLILGRIRRDA